MTIPADIRNKAIAREGKHISKTEETITRHQMRDKEITAAHRNAKAAARLAASLARTYEELLVARIEAKARR